MAYTSYHCVYREDVSTYGHRQSVAWGCVKIWSSTKCNVRMCQNMVIDKV